MAPGGDKLTEQCPCIYPDVDPEDETETCACGHAADEHDESGQCQAVITSA